MMVLIRLIFWITVIVLVVGWAANNAPANSGDGETYTGEPVSAGEAVYCSDALDLGCEIWLDTDAARHYTLQGTQPLCFNCFSQLYPCVECGERRNDREPGLTCPICKAEEPAEPEDPECCEPEVITETETEVVTVTETEYVEKEVEVPCSDQADRIDELEDELAEKGDLLQEYREAEQFEDLEEYLKENVPGFMEEEEPEFAYRLPLWQVLTIYFLGVAVVAAIGFYLYSRAKSKPRGKDDDYGKL